MYFLLVTYNFLTWRKLPNGHKCFFSEFVDSHVTDTNVYNMHKTTDSEITLRKVGQSLACVVDRLGNNGTRLCWLRYYLLTAMGSLWLAPEDWVKCRLLTYLTYQWTLPTWTNFTGSSVMIAAPADTRRKSCLSLICFEVFVMEKFVNNFRHW